MSSSNQVDAIKKELHQTIEYLTNVESLESAQQELLPIALRELRKEKGYGYKKKNITPPLPDYGKPPAGTSRDGCKWLDEYIEYSKLRSPRSYDKFHETCGVSLLSGVAAGRVRTFLGKWHHPNLYNMVVAKTSTYSKTGATSVIQDVLSSVGLDFLIGADEKTPQAFIKKMMASLPTNFDNIDPDIQQRIIKSLPFSNAVIWRKEEFGSVIRAMASRGGVMEGWWGLLRHLYDCPEWYEYDTIKHGSLFVKEPYLSLVGTMTPKDLIDLGKKNGVAWGDGYLARFGFCCPSSDERGSRARWNIGKMDVPNSVKQPLIDWHLRLGIQSVDIEPEYNERTGKETGGKNVVKRGNKQYHQLAIAPDVIDWFYEYNNALKDLSEPDKKIIPDDLAGSYDRLAIMALKLCLLFASLDNCQQIELRHWARAVEIVENWREGLHNLYEQINDGSISEKKSVEDIIVELIMERGAMSIANLKHANRTVRSRSSAELKPIIDALVKEGQLVEVRDGRKLFYDIQDPDSG